MIGELGAAADRLRDAGAVLGDHLADAERRAGELLEQRGGEEAPRDTGKLASSVMARITSGQLLVVAAAPYAAHVHAHNPWLRRVLDASTDDIADLYRTAAADAVAAIAH